MTFYVTFGPAQRTEWEEKIYNSLCVAVVNCKDTESGMKLINRVFKNGYSNIYCDDEWDHSSIANYSRGYVILKYHP